MRKIKTNFIFLVVLLSNIITAQKVSNIAFRQEQSNIIVSYDLETRIPCSVSLFVSINGGANWNGPLKKVTGNVGVNIASGSQRITWSVLDEFEELRGDKIQFQVRAYGDNIETIKIGNQEWMTKNLDVSTYRNGDNIPEVKDQNKWKTLTTGAWCYYNNDPKNAEIYGKLYNWYAVNDPRGIAPEGFHVPNKGELEMVIDNNKFTRGIATEGFNIPTKDEQDMAKVNNRFIGLLGGWRGRDNIAGNYFHGIGSYANWWSSSELDTAFARYVTLNHESHIANMTSYYKISGFSVRCLKN
jgi:uncharacterized protein (TIGR02145 family)